MEIKLVRSNLTNNTQFEPIKNLGQSVRLASLTEDAEIFSTIDEIQVTDTAFDVKIGDKLNVNGQLLTIRVDASATANILYVNSVTLDFYLEAYAPIKIDNNNLFVQYQRKTEGSVAGFEVDETGLTKGSVKITGFLNSDTMEGATVENLPTSLSVKNYVDTQVGATDSLQEVTDIGNTTTQDIIVNNLTAASPSVPQNGPKLLSKGTIWNSGLGNKTTEGGMQIAPDTNNANPSISKLSFLVGTDNSSATEQMYVTSQGQFNILGGGDFAGTSLDDLNSVLIRNTETAGSSAPKNSNKLVFEGKFWNSAQGSKTNQGYIQLLSTTNNANPFINRLGFFTQEGVNGGSYTEQVSIVNNGNVGIGETTPSEKLDVNGTVKATNLKISGSEVDFTGLPTSDPSVAGRLYIDDTFIKISEG